MGSKNNPQVYDYRYSLDYALCQGPIDSLNYVWIKDKRAFCGAIVSREDICVNDDKLFGGDTAEGGIEGVIEVYMGDQHQYASMDLARRMGFAGLVEEGQTPGPDHWTNAPAYPGIAHLFFRRTGYGHGGFKWGTNNPYLPGVKASVTRIPRDLWDQYAAIRPLTAVYEAGEVPDQQDPTTYGAGAAFPVTDPALIQETTIAKGNYKSWNNGPVGSYIVEWWYQDQEYYRLVQPDKIGVCDVDYRETGLSEDALARQIRLGRNSGGGKVPADVVRAGAAWIEITVSAFVTGFGLGGGGMTGVTHTVMMDQYAEDADGNPGPRVGFDWATENVEATVITFPLKPETKFIKLGISTNPAWVWNWARIDVQDIKAKWWPLDHRHCDMDTNLGELPDANPAHIIYELLVDAEERDNTDLAAFVNQASLRNVAETLFNEGFGVSIRQDQQLDRRALIKSLCEHVRGAVFQHPRTGQWDMKLFRDDYDFDTLQIITTADAEIVSGQRRAWSQCISEITVEYTDPQEEKKATVTSHFDAGAAITGNRVPEVRAYPFIRNSALAQIVADRDVVEASYPLWSGSIKLSRRFWETVPGNVFRLQYVDDDFNIADMVIRITSVNYGAITDRTITVEAVEDIFSVAKTTYREPQHPIVDPSSLPLPRRAGRPQYLIPMSLPYALIERLGYLDNLTYPTSHYQTLIASNIDFSLEQVTVYRRGENSTFDYGYEFPPSPAARVTTSYPFAVTSRISQSIIEQIAPSGVEPGTILMFAPDNPLSEMDFIANDNFYTKETETELIELVEFDPETAEWIVKRGLFDTVPRDWVVGSTILINVDAAIQQAVLFDTVPVYAEEDEYPFFGKSTSRGYTTSDHNMWRVPYSETPRNLHPTRPANVQVNGVGPEPLIDTAINSTIEDLVITWSSRNKTTEEADPPFWDDGNAIPEDNTQYTVIVRDAINPATVRHTETGILTQTFTLPVEVAAPTGAVTIEVYAVINDGVNPEVVSIFGSQNYVQIDRIALEWQGWDYNWGRNWGGAPLV